MEDTDKGLIKKYKNRMGMFGFIKGLAIFFIVLCHVLANLAGNEFLRNWSILIRRL